MGHMSYTEQSPTKIHLKAEVLTQSWCLCILCLFWALVGFVGLGSQWHKPLYNMDILSPSDPWSRESVGPFQERLQKDLCTAHHYSHTQSEYRCRVKARIDMPHLLYLSKCLEPNSEAIQAAQPHLLNGPGPCQMHISTWFEHRFIPALWLDVKFEPLHSSVYTHPKWKHEQD